MAALAKQLRAALDNEDVDLGGYGQVFSRVRLRFPVRAACLVVLLLLQRHPGRRLLRRRQA